MVQGDLAPQLSIIVPLLNEEETLPGLLANLGGQYGVRIELILCDGGSTDGTLELCRQATAAPNVNARLVLSPAGRGQQMNAAARVATAATLLFLHADSRFSSPLALSEALAAYRRARSASGPGPLAGHFRLCFSGPGADTAPYYFYSCKAQSGRPGTIHGDQGFLIGRKAFCEMGGFLESLPFLEDHRFAERVLATGDWLLLPAEILTSTRRFHREGLLQRQVLNALVMNFAAIGWELFFAEVPGLYRQQDTTAKLQLLPFLNRIRELLATLPVAERRRLWRRTGGYVRSQGWQLGLALDCRANRRAGHAPGAGPTPWLQWFDRWFEQITDHPPGRALTTVLVFCWFHLTRFRLARRQAREGATVGDRAL
ncbi:TIGR04283 family arsenosugar biosynthesis glycosyltransferase [Desulfuromonas carbonis]